MALPAIDTAEEKAWTIIPDENDGTENSAFLSAVTCLAVLFKAGSSQTQARQTHDLRWEESGGVMVERSQLEQARKAQKAYSNRFWAIHRLFHSVAGLGLWRFDMSTI